MLVKYNKKAKQHIGSVIDYYLENYSLQAATNLAHEIDEKVKMLRKYPGIGFREPLLMGHYEQYRATIVGQHYKIILYKGEHPADCCFLGYENAPRQT
jgi:plasmid stabilization system protein ParE